MLGLPFQIKLVISLKWYNKYVNSLFVSIPT